MGKVKPKQKKPWYIYVGTLSVYETENFFEPEIALRRIEAFYDFVCCQN